MKTDQCGDDVIVHLTNPQILTETVSLVGSSTAELIPTNAGVVGGGAARASSAAVECGRRLLLAARAGDTATVRALMVKGAPFTTDWLGTSPLHLAAANDHTETVCVLLRAGVCPDARTKVQRTPLHLAAHAGHGDTVGKLLEGGAAVDAQDLLLMTPLHWAVERGHQAAAKALLRHGADVHAESKFRKTPLSMATDAAQRGDNAMLKLIEKSLKQREAAISVDALVTERTAEEAATVTQTEASTVRIQRLTDTKIASPKITSTPEKRNPKSAIRYLDLNAASGAVGGGGGATVGGATVSGGGAEALLRRHGITLLPADDGSTVLNALQSGRTVVLSDAGKLMLKESSSIPQSIIANTPPRTDAAGGGAAAGAGGVVLTATPVTAPPPGVRVFTLNSNAKLLPLKEQKQPAPQTHRREERSDVQQVKLVQLGGAGATAKSNSGGGVGGGGGGGAGGRAAVRIIMNKQNFKKLIATATRATVAEDPLEMDAEEVEESSGSEEEGESVVVVPEQFVRSTSPQYLRSQLLCAHAALHHLHQRLRRTRDRVALLQQHLQQ